MGYNSMTSCSKLELCELLLKSLVVLNDNKRTHLHVYIHWFAPALAFPARAPSPAAAPVPFPVPSPDAPSHVLSLQQDGLDGLRGRDNMHTKLKKHNYRTVLH